MDDLKFSVIKTRRQDGVFVEKFELAMLGEHATIRHAKEHVDMLNSCDNGFWYELVNSDIRIQRKFEFIPQYAPEKKRKNPILLMNPGWSWNNPF